MEDNSRINDVIKWALGAMGLGGVIALVALPRFGVSVWIVVAILVLFLLLFGGYFLWRHLRARGQREHFTASVEAQTAAAPRAVSDPDKRARLDKLRQKFQNGLREYKSRGKDLYKLPWYVFIGESGSGKTEAIRHSGIDFPPGLQDELQGSGGTINMDWWFTNHGIILDTAGSMIFDEARAGDSPEWREFLRLLKKSRPQCPINGLFLVLSVESLIKDSADRIAQKAGKLAQQLDLIQRTLDVRFPVYLLVTKCDLLTGFREFFDNIEDPLLQHQIFGWSNPDPLDTHFRPDLVEQNLRTIADRLRRRRLALLRESSLFGGLGEAVPSLGSAYQLGRGAPGVRRIDEVDHMAALTESIMRLAPRLRRYLETIFVAGEWSAMPVFLRGIYFTSSMREGNALDEAIALATGLPLEQLPEERKWAKDRAYFLRDLFIEKVFRERGLVTRATNTLKLLRTRQLAIFGTAGVALLLLLVFGVLSYKNLQKSVGTERKYWQAGTNWANGVWSPSIVQSGATNPFRFTYAGTNLIGLDKLTVADYHFQLKEVATTKLRVGWIFKPIPWLFGKGEELDRPAAQRLVFEGGVLRPLVARTQDKLERIEIEPSNPRSEARHREALKGLLQLERDRMIARSVLAPFTRTNAAEYLKTFMEYLTEADFKPDTNLVEAFVGAYATKGWPPTNLLRGDRLTNNLPIQKGLLSLRKCNQTSQVRIQHELQALNGLSESMRSYLTRELGWLASSQDACPVARELGEARKDVDMKLGALLSATNYSKGPFTNLASRYAELARAAGEGSGAAFQEFTAGPSNQFNTTGLFGDIAAELKKFISDASQTVQTNFASRSDWIPDIDAKCLGMIEGQRAFELRWKLYTGACALASEKMAAEDRDIGGGWTNFIALSQRASEFREGLKKYQGPYADTVSNACERIAGQAQRQLGSQYLADYVKLVTAKLAALTSGIVDFEKVTNARPWLARVEADLAKAPILGAQAPDIEPVKRALASSRQAMLDGYVAANKSQLRSGLAFPVVLQADPATALGPEAVIQLRKLLDRLDHESRDLVWQSYPGSPEALAPLLSSPYQAVVNALVGTNDALAAMDLFYLPPEQTNEKGRTIRDVFRWPVISIGSKKDDSKDLSRYRAPELVGQGTLDLGITIAFRRNQSDAQPEVPLVVSNWGLLRLIRDGKAQRLENGAKWKIEFELKDTETGSSGPVAFEVRLKSALPEVKDWPKP